MAADKGAPGIALTLLSGFLGSGKTTLLNRLLPQPALGRCAVVVNEFGAIGLDHLLVRATQDETVVLLENGCLCCSARDEVATTVARLLESRGRGDIPAFDRLIVETTGLARPGPIVSLLLGDPDLDGRLRLDGVITTVDAMHGAEQLAKYEESRQQVAVADRLLVTKADLAEAADVAALDAKLDSLNPGVPRHLVRHGNIDAALMMDVLTPRSLSRWLRAEPVPHPLARGAHRTRHTHAEVANYCITYEKPLPMRAFEAALTMLLGYYGEHVLRVKGIGHFIGESRPVVFHGVQQYLHEPMYLDSWPDADRTTRIVFIVQGIERAVIENTIAQFLHDPQWKE